MKFKDLTEEQKALLRSIQGIRKDNDNNFIGLEKVQEFSFQGKNDDDIIAVLTVPLFKNRTFLEARMLECGSQGMTFDSILEDLKDRKEVLQKILLNQDCRLLRFAIANKKIGAFQSILGAKDDKEVVKEILTSTVFTRVNVFNGKLYHYFFYNYYTLLELCALSHSYCNEKAECKEFIETILNSARENEILDDVLTASGIKKDLAKRLSYEKYSNDVIINVLQKNQKAEEMSTTAGIVSFCIILLPVIFGCKEYSGIGTGWSIAIGIAGAIVAACTIGYGTYKLFQPNTQMLATDASKKVGSEVTMQS